MPTDYNKPSQEELEAFWKGDDKTRLKLYNERMGRKAAAAEAAGKQVTYSPPNNSLQEITAKPLDKPNTRMSTNDMIDFGITAAGFVPGLDTAADIADVGNQLRQGNYGSALLSAGLSFIPGVSAPMVRRGMTWLRGVLGDVAESAGRGLFNHIPYKTINEARSAKRKVSGILTQGPYTYYKEQLRKNLRTNPQFMLDEIEEVALPKGTITNSTEDAMELLKSRHQHRQDNSPTRILSAPYSKHSENIKVYDYLPLKEIRRIVNGDSNKSTWADPIFWAALNYNPASAFPGTGIIHINPAHLKAHGWGSKAQIQNVTAHEFNHSLYNTPVNIEGFPNGFSYSHLRPHTQNYFNGFNNTELWARGTQLKNYFGLKGGEEITPDMLKYAAKHYVKDTGVNNNMTQFFSGIKDWKEAAKQLSNNSLKNGGQITHKQ